jgi:L-ribulose-5-phosphate 4-epimerase
VLEKLKTEVLNANRSLVQYGLVILTWGNVSGIDREKNLVVIKPSGIEYDKLTIDDLVVVNLDGRVVEGNRRPSSDTPTHLALYRAFDNIGGISHTHSDYATTFAQAGCAVHCYGTTHADYFNGTIPITRLLTKSEVNRDYELNTGKVIIECFQGLDPLAMPAVLVAGHAPFTWGKNATEAAKNSYILEKVAQLAFQSILLNENLTELPEYIRQKHYLRKHGPSAYYGQNGK